MSPRAVLLSAAAIALAVGTIAAAAPPEAKPQVVFSDAALFFAPDSTSFFQNPAYRVEDNGRVASTRVLLPESTTPVHLEARISMRPVPHDERSVYDRWDRAGNLRLVLPGAADLELARFMTAYGGRTEWTYDLSDYAPLLRGGCDFALFVDTWVHPAWRADVTLTSWPDTSGDVATWAAPIYYDQNVNAEAKAAGDEVTVEIPSGLARVVLRYLSTGHCTDGRDEDEFVAKANVISVDGVVVERFHPWRTDCDLNRAINPYCSRWTDGSWSSDYDRSGWCPGREVAPREIDLSDHLTAGRHRVGIRIEEMRPKDADGNYGYWRVSAALVGWKSAPHLWHN